MIEKECANNDEGNNNRRIVKIYLMDDIYIKNIYNNHIHTYNYHNKSQYLPIAILSRTMSMYNLHQYIIFLDSPCLLCCVLRITHYSNSTTNNDIEYDD